MMQKRQKRIVVILLCALFAYSNLWQGEAMAKITKKGYTISKNAGTYEKSVSVKISAKKGYRVYYTTSKKLSKSKVIKAKKSKTLVFKKTKTLRVYAVKSKKKMSSQKLKAIKTNKMAKYNYKIVEALEKKTTNPTQDVSTSLPSKEDVSANATQQPTSSVDTTTKPVVETPAPTAPGVQTNPPVITPSPLTTPSGSQYEGDDSASDYVEPVRFSYDADDNNTSVNGATYITMPAEATGEKFTTDTYQISKKNKLTITAPGTYVVQTEAGKVADGLIEVDYADETAVESTHLILNGVNLTSSNNTEPDSDTGLITIKKSVARVILTIADGSVNTLTDTGETGIDKDDGVSTTYTAGIVCKKTPLTINGSGTLHIVSTNGNGIKCTDYLKVIGTTVQVSGPNDTSTGHNGITAKLGLAVKNASLTVKSDGDSLKTTLDEEDIAADSTLAALGNLEIDGGSYHLSSANGDGVYSYRTMFLNPTSLQVTTKSGATSSTDGSYKGIKAGTSIYVPQSAGTISVESMSDDSIHCNGYIKLDGGTYQLASGDDGIHSDSGLVINGGNINITTSYEGLESGDISINGGVITVVAKDDGMNAAGGNDAASNGGGRPGDWFNKGESATNANYQIVIRGGELSIDAGGDGVDSNGNIFFQGGTVTVNGPTNSGNGALDYGDFNSICEVSGGTLIASGAVGMDAAPTSGSSQPTINVRLSSTQTAGTYVVIKDSEGNVVLQAKPTKSFQSVIMSCEALKLGNSYTICYGKDLNSLTEASTLTLTSTSMSTGSSSGGGWNPGGGRPR